MSTMRTWLVVVCMAASAVTSWAQEDKKKDGADQPKSATSFNLAYATYSEKVGRVEVIVSSYGASFEESSKFFMLQVAVGVIGKFGAELDFSDKSFTLLDSQGNLYAMAPAEELSQQEKLLDYAEEMQRNEPIQTDRNFTNLAAVESNFYAEDGMRWTDVHVGYDSYFSDVLFFPKPAAGFVGVFTLNVLTKGMEQPVEVRFEFPAVKDKDKNKGEKTGS